MRRASVLFAILVLCIAGCGDQKTIPFLGQWDGGFTVEKVLKGGDSPEDRKRHKLKGYIKVVLNKKGYQMHLEGEQQTVDIKGTWKYNGKQLTLEPSEVKIGPDDKDDGLDPNRKSVEPDELYLAYLKKFTFSISKDGKTLNGLTTTVAILEGTHSFNKE